MTGESELRKDLFSSEALVLTRRLENLDPSDRDYQMTAAAINRLQNLMSNETKLEQLEKVEPKQSKFEHIFSTYVVPVLPLVGTFGGLLALIKFEKADDRVFTSKGLSWLPKPKM